MPPSIHSTKGGVTSPHELKIGDLITIAETITRHTAVAIPETPFDTPDYKILNDALIKRQIPWIAGIPFRVEGIALPMILAECLVPELIQKTPPIVWFNATMVTFCVVPKRYAARYRKYYQEMGLAGQMPCLDNQGNQIEQLTLNKEEELPGLEELLNFLAKKSQKE
jgi:hypothetical protein